jgi:hypothetical protein
MAAAAGFLALAWLRTRREAHAVRGALAASLAWLSHVSLDYLGNDSNPPIGLMALWPFTSAYYKFPWPVFLDIGRSLEWQTLLNNLVAASWEAVLLLPLLWMAWTFAARRRSLAA